MEIFSANPKSFNIRRTSPLATSELKPAISAKLLHFLPDLTDDVFAEYITVLVCNGKNQYQAREDLDAFLGEKTEEFVSWLWGHLLKRARKWGIESGLKNHDASFTSPGNSDRDNDPRTRNTDLIDGLLACRKENSIIVSPREGSTDLTDGLLACRKDISIKVSTREGSTPVISAKRDQGARCMKKPKQMLDRKVLLALKEITCFAKRDPALKTPQSSVSDHPSSRQGRVSTSPRSVRTSSSPTKRQRVSVWDRLGKPSTDVPEEGENVSLFDVGDKKQDEKAQKQCVSVASGLDGEAAQHNKGYRDLNKCHESEKLKNCVTGTFDLDTASNIQRKRRFRETNGGSNTNSVPSKDEGMLVSPVNEICQKLKKSKLATIDLGSPPNFASIMLEMKQRLHNMEMEMSKLRSKQQVKIEKDGKPCPMSNPSDLKLLEEDSDSRTIFVTNVHFAATKEALSSFFAKCGIIVNVVKMTDRVTAKPNGCAYVIFASKDSVDKAMALSGTIFLSRIVKVSRKKEADTAASTLPQLAQKPSRASTSSSHVNAVPGKPYYYSPYRLQWRREIVIGPSGLSASESVGKIAPSSFPLLLEFD